MNPSSQWVRQGCPGMSNYTNHRSSTISCHSQMGIQAVVLVFRLSVRSCGQKTTWLLLTVSWWLPQLVQPRTHILLPSPWHNKWSLAVYVYASSGVQPHHSLFYYIHFWVRADFTAICLFGHVVSQWETRPEASITTERGNRADQAELSIRQAGVTWAGLVCCVLEKSRGRWKSSAAVTEACCLFKELEVEPQPQ